MHTQVRDLQVEPHRVKDAREQDAERVDVHLICEHCGARNTITREAEVVERGTE